MKTTIAVLAAFMLTLLIGCSDQSPVSGPQSASTNLSTQLGRAGYDVTIDQIIVGPTGVKYRVWGTIGYKFDRNGNEYSLVTSVNLTVNQSGTENTWLAVGGKGFVSSFNEEWRDVSEQVGFEYGKFRLPAHYVLIGYGVTPAGVTVNTLQILDAAGIIATID